MGDGYQIVRAEEFVLAGIVPYRIVLAKVANP